MVEVIPGLRGIYALDTRISGILEEADPPSLMYRGRDITELKDNPSYVSVAFLIIYGRWPNTEESKGFGDKIYRASGSIPEDVSRLINSLKRKVPDADALMLLRAGLSAYSAGRADAIDPAEILGTIHGLCRQIMGKDSLIKAKYLSKDPATNLFYDSGIVKDIALCPSLNASLWLHADHGLNNSTFTLRTIMSTESDILSGIIGAISSLKGPLHGGASADVQEVIDMIIRRKISQQDVLVEVMRADFFKKNKKVPGFGHAVYKKGDPRARMLKGLVREHIRTDNDIFRSACLLEEAMLHVKPARPLYPNIDFWSSTLYRIAGIPNRINTLIFAAARSAGWIAHALEQHENNVLIRPRARYIQTKISEDSFDNGFVSGSAKIALSSRADY